MRGDNKGRVGYLRGFGAHLGAGARCGASGLRETEMSRTLTQVRIIGLLHIGAVMRDCGLCRDGRRSKRNPMMESLKTSTWKMCNEREV